MRCPSQQTQDAADALTGLTGGDFDLVLTPPVLVEFDSVLRALLRRRVLTDLEAADVRLAVRELQARVEWRVGIEDRGFELARLLNASDTFDTTGYAVAEALGAEFWVSDRRFAEAAAHASLPNVHFVT
jgi:predicted nucleic acid-binding protein